MVLTWGASMAAKGDVAKTDGEEAWVWCLGVISKEPLNHSGPQLSPPCLDIIVLSMLRLASKRVIWTTNDFQGRSPKIMS